MVKLRTLTLAIFVAALLLAGCGADATPVSQETVQVDLEALPVNMQPADVAAIADNPEVVIIDVREPFEYDEGHIPGAQLIPLGTIPDRINEIPTDKTVIAVCRSGNRSGQATEYLRQQGFDNVHNMNGGMNDWQAAGYEVEK